MSRGTPIRAERCIPLWVMIVARLGILLLPGILLLVGSLRVTGEAQLTLGIGALMQLVAFSVLLLTRRAWQEPPGTAATVLYLVAIAWLWLSRSLNDNWYSHFTQFMLLVVPLTLFALQTLNDSGASASRRANLLSQRLSQRKDWPHDMNEIRLLPEVMAFREALDLDASPALRLLQHSRPQVRLAALAALEFRSDWKPGQAEIVLNFAQRSHEPLLRAAAVTALGNLDDRLLVEQLAEFLCDPDRTVRRAATEALLWRCEERWPWIRHAVHQALADPRQLGDGSLLVEGVELSPEAVADLTAWAAEKGPAAERAAVTLGNFYNKLLTTQSSDPHLIRELKGLLLDASAPSTLRIELCQVLNNLGEMSQELLEKLLPPPNPGPLRLFAADALLGAGPHPPALATLRELARVPNREIALNTADVIQRRLGIDMGLPLGQPLPPVHSRLAADVMRRLMRWATQESANDTKVDHPESKRRGTGSGTFPIPTGRH